jgi:hypothetical protein
MESNCSDFDRCGKRKTTKTAIRAGVALIAASVGATWCLFAATNTGPEVKPSALSQSAREDTGFLEGIAAGIPHPVKPAVSGQPFIPTIGSGTTYSLRLGKTRFQQRQHQNEKTN